MHPRFRTLPAIVGLAVFTAGAAASPLPAQVPGYRGKYVRDPAFQRAFKDLEAHRRAALASSEARLGIRPPEPDAIVIEVRDAVPAEPETLKRFEGPSFTTEGDGQGRRVRITIYAEFIVSGRFDLAEELRHEMVHAVMRQAMAAEAYRALPKWMREGVAVWAADQTDRKLLHTLVTHRAFRDASAICPGVDQGQHGTERYGEYGVAFDLLVQKAGNDAVARWIAAMREGMEATAALARVSELSMDELRTASRDLCLARARSLEPAGFDDYLAIARADKERQYAQAADLAEAFLATYRDGPLAADVLYWHGKACRLAKEPARGQGSLERLVDEVGARCDFFDEALYQIGSTHLEAREFKAAAPFFERILRDVPDAANLDRVLLRLATCRAEMGEKKKAAATLTLLERSFPKSPMLKDAAELKTKL